MPPQRTQRKRPKHFDIRPEQPAASSTASDQPAAPLTPSGNGGNNSAVASITATAGLEQEPPELPETATPNIQDWEDAPVVGSRSYKVTRVKLIQAKLKALGVPPKDARVVEVWSIWVADQNSSEDSEMEVYGERAGTSETRAAMVGGAIDTSICANESEALQLGERVCRLLDRFPYQLPSLEMWRKLTLPRRWVQARALDIWRRPFDRTRLAEAHRDLDIIGPFHRGRKAEDGEWAPSIALLFTDAPKSSLGGRGSAYLRLRLPWNMIDAQKLSALPDVPADFSYGLRQTEKLLPKEANPVQQGLLAKAFRRLLYAVAFKVGTKPAFKQIVTAEFSRFSTTSKSVSGIVLKKTDRSKQHIQPQPKQRAPEQRLPKRTKSPLMGRIWDSIRLAVGRELMAGGVELNRELLFAELLVTSPRIGDGVWKDMNDGERLSADGTWPADYTPRRTSGRRVPHPCTASLDAILPFVMVEGRSAYHHQSNIGLTTLAINFAKHFWPPCILAVFRAAAINSELEGNTNPVSRNLALHRDINNAMDRIHRIDALVPYTLKKKLSFTSDDVDEAFMKRYTESCRSSSWDPKQGYLDHRLIYRSCRSRGDELRLNTIKEGGAKPSIAHHGDTASDAKTPVWPPWTQEQKTQMGRIVDEIENNSLINIYSLKIPRGGNGAPWPFRKDHMFQDDDLWEWWYHEALGRYHGMFWLCNWAHDTEESPMTILLEIVVQCFRTGGVYDWIHIEMTVFQRHPSRYSLGRSANVEPGSPMYTGFVLSEPTSSRDHYDVNRCTIVVQPFFVNLLWLDFPISSHPLLKKLLLGLSAETVHYTKFQRDSAAVEYPKLSRVHQRQHGAIENGPETLEEEIDADETPDVLVSLFDEDEDESGSDDDSSDGDIVDDPDEMVPFLNQHLQDEFRSLRTQLETMFPDFEYDEHVHRYLRKLRKAKDTGNADRFYALNNDLEDFLIGQDPEKCCVCHKELIDGLAVECLAPDHVDAYFHPSCSTDDLEAQSGGDLKALCPVCKSNQKTVSKCFICDEPAPESSMLICSNPAHGGAVFHFWCAGLQGMPHDESTMLCPACKTQEASSNAPGSGNWNMHNEGATCYISSPVQILCRLDPIQELLKSHGEITGKSAERSGRQVREWLPSSFPLNPDVSDKTVNEWSAQQMQSTQDMYRSFAEAVRHLNKPEGPVDRKQSRELITRIQATNPKEWQNATNDSADLFVHLLDSIILLTDDSMILQRGGLSRLNKRQEQQLELAKLASLAEASFSQWDAYTGEGRTSAITGRFCTQSVLESGCPDSSCPGIRRGFMHETVFTLILPDAKADSGQFELHRILQKWSRDTTTSSCPLSLEIHSVGDVALYRKITICPEILSFRFNRSTYDGGIREEHVDVPEYLDISLYGDGVELPSDMGNGATSFKQRSIYRLIAVNMFIPRSQHFVAYVLVNNVWLLFDDMRSSEPATPRHPQAAINEGSVPYFVVYQQQKDRGNLPVDVRNQTTTGHILSKNAAVPDAKVQDLYEVTPIVSDEDPGFHVQDPEEVFQCQMCDATLSSEIALSVHKETHPFCVQCSERLPDQAALDGHVTAAHPDLTCESCGEILPDQSALDTHVESVHSHAGVGSEELTGAQLVKAILNATASARRTMEDMAQREHQMLQREQQLLQREQEMQAAHSQRRRQLLQDESEVLRAESDRLKLRQDAIAARQREIGIEMETED